MKPLSIFILFLFFILSSKAQNIVSGLKDKNGKLWFSVSDRAVYSYAGSTFSNFTKACYKSNIHITECLYEDKNGDIWFITTNGLCYYDGKKFTDFKIPFPPSSLMSADKYAVLLRNPVKVSKMLQDHAGNFWFLTNDHGVYLYHSNWRDSLGHEKSFTNYLLDIAPNCILETKNNTIYIGSWNGAGVWRSTNQQAHAPADFKQMTGFSDGMIACLLEDHAGKIWVGTRNAAVDCYNPSISPDPDKKPVINFTEKDGLTNNTICCLIEDSGGKIWLGSDVTLATKRGDAFCYDGKTFISITAKATLTHVEGFVYGVKSLLEDKTGKIWIGSKDGILLCYDGNKLIDFSEKLTK